MLRTDQFKEPAHSAVQLKVSPCLFHVFTEDGLDNVYYN